MRPDEIQQFQEVVWQYYAEANRDLLWRHPDADGSFDPYKIMVSEIMLQQTQVSRVTPKYQEFLQAFPDVNTLAKAPLSAVLTAWNGLGYNRRAKYLWQAAQVIAQLPNGFPTDLAGLVALPGIGKNTAGAILVYAYNQPVVYIETNIRTVYIHHFFVGQTAVSDADILLLVAETLDNDDPRQWYWALMDYGSHIKRTTGNASRSSKSFAKQSTFAGSLRQVRGRVIKQLLAGPRNFDQLSGLIDDPRLKVVVGDLVREELVVFAGDQYRLPD